MGMASTHVRGRHIGSGRNLIDLFIHRDPVGFDQALKPPLAVAFFIDGALLISWYVNGIESVAEWQYIGSPANEARHATPKERNADYQDYCRD